MTIEVKICGLTSLDDSRAALEAGADYLGFVLYPPSPRSIAPDRVGAILRELPGARAVGVLVNESRERAERLARDCGLCAVQIHGERGTAEEMGGLPVPVWRATKVEGGQWQPAPAEWPAARYVADATAPGLHGGTGVTADWAQAARLAARAPVMLAGGLTPENVAGAIRAVRPLGVDVASGVEAAAGRKDWDKMRRFIAAARRAAEELE